MASVAGSLGHTHTHTQPLKMSPPPGSHPLALPLRLGHSPECAFAYIAYSGSLPHLLMIYLAVCLSCERGVPGRSVAESL